MRTFALAAVGALLAPQVAAQCQPWQHDSKVRCAYAHASAVGSAVRR
jgi:hypothetical protein